LEGSTLSGNILWVLQYFLHALPHEKHDVCYSVRRIISQHMHRSELARVFVPVLSGWNP
jgi:hypothetical protein